MQPEILKQVLETLSVTQGMIEKSSFDCINQHDKVTNLVSELMVSLNNMTMKLEMIHEHLEEIMELEVNSGMHDKKLEGLSKMLEEQTSLQAETNQYLQTIIEEQSLENEVIHDMEMQIADQREVIDEVCYIEK